MDLIAVDAKYHSACRASYVSKTNLKHQIYKERNKTDECKYESAFQDLLSEINPGILGGKAYEMSFLVERYRMMLTLKGMKSSKSYRSEKLKKRLKNHFLDSIIFHKQPDPSRPVQSIINATANFPRCEDHTESSTEAEQDTEIEKLKVLYNAASVLKSDIKTCEGISIQPLSVANISLDSGRHLLPDSMYSFLCWMVSGHNDVDPKKGIAIPFCNNADDDRRILMRPRYGAHNNAQQS